ncbi:MAG: bifunctional hydroxymethylpyrimidine kinase/phosphomethylpyrimidine kinase [bacterium]|nr:bifunctional hydroxymethylpyrimidine kinase/phosphomethylpyrimidine kinase [bacterium]
MKMMNGAAALTVAGSDSGGGAGIQADLKTFSALGVFGASVITAVTAQNLEGVTAIQAIEPGVVRKQLTAVLEGFPVTAVKTGMLLSAEIIAVVAGVLSEGKYRDIPLVIDPVFAATSGSKLIRDEGIVQLKETLFPLGSLITPNMPEAEILTGMVLTEPAHLEEAARKMYETFGVPVLMKGGHLEDRALDILFDGGEPERYESPLVKGVNNHGSGCTLASAIAAAMARGQSLRQAIDTAKTFIQHALEENLELLPGLRVINHFNGV